MQFRPGLKLINAEKHRSPALETQNQRLLKRVQAKLRDGSAINPISVVVESNNQGGFHTKMSMRDHQIVSDQPFGFDGTNQGPKPSELFLAALAACQETTYRIYAEAIGINIDRIAVTFTGKRDLRGFMSLDEEVPAGFVSIEGEVQIETEATTKELKDLQVLVDRFYPVLDDLKRQVAVGMRLTKMKN